VEMMVKRQQIKMIGKRRSGGFIIDTPKGMVFGANIREILKKK
jgi:hypothetical protein